MELTNLLPVEHVVCVSDANMYRRDLLAALAEPLVNDGIVTDMESFLDAIELRESDMSTQMKGGIAIPHACTTAVRKLGLVVGKVADPGAAFDPDKTEPCKIFFMICIPAASPAAHLPLLSHLCGFITAQDKLDKLNSLSSPEEIHKLLVSWKNN